MKYCRITTEAHEIAVQHPHCLEDLNYRIGQEDQNDIVTIPLFTNQETILNCDLLEETTNPQGQNSSMDIAFCIKNSENDSKHTVLTEFKFNVINPNNISTGDLLEKVKGTLAAIGNTPPVYHEHYFIYPTEHVQQAKNRFSRKLSKVNANFYIPMDVAGLKEKFFD